jgi:hypothetical protein
MRRMNPASVAGSSSWAALSLEDMLLKDISYWWAIDCDCGLVINCVMLGIVSRVNRVNRANNNVRGRACLLLKSGR